MNGTQTVVNRPVALPLSVGRHWVVDYAEEHPNPREKSRHYRSEYRVIGREQVTVPAGTFQALTIEAEGLLTATFLPASGAAVASRNDAQGTTAIVRTQRVAETTASGRTYKAFWYVPRLRRWVRAVEEYYDPQGVRTELYRDELEAFHLAD